MLRPVPSRGRELRMAASGNFQREQRGIAVRMLAALCVTILVSAACLHLGARAPRILQDRLIVVAKADLFVICWLVAAIGNVARLRFFSADDIAGSGSASATSDVRSANAVLQNTLEQVTLAIPVHVILAILVASSAPLIIALVTLFVIGRLLFWLGYAHGAQSRAFGFALTFYPSIGGLGVAVVAAVRASL